MLRISSQNLQHGGGQHSDGTADLGRFEGIMHAIQEEKPDVLCLQEIHGWRDRNFQPLFDAQDALDMQVCGWIPQGRSLGGTLVMYRPSSGLKMRQWENFNNHELYNGLGVAVLDIGGPRPLAVASVHFPAASPVAAEQESVPAMERVYRYGGVGGFFGDVNTVGLNDPEPDFKNAPLLNRTGLFTIDDEGKVRVDRRVARRLTLGGMTDVAAHLAEATGDTSLLASTGARDVRRDHGWVTPPMVPAIAGYRRRRHDGSDHALVSFDFDPALIAERVPESS